jgi:hypothetical protein
MVLAGITTSPLEEMHSISYVSSPWVTSLRTFLTQFNSTIHIPQIKPINLTSVNDKPIMDTEHLSDISKLDQEMINACRIFLQVNTLSEICSQQGTHILACVENCNVSSDGTPVLFKVSISTLGIIISSSKISHIIAVVVRSSSNSTTNTDNNMCFVHTFHCIKINYFQTKNQISLVLQCSKKQLTCAVKNHNSHPDSPNQCLVNDCDKLNDLHLVTSSFKSTTFLDKSVQLIGSQVTTIDGSNTALLPKSCSPYSSPIGSSSKHHI